MGVRCRLQACLSSVVLALPAAAQWSPAPSFPAGAGSRAWPAGLAANGALYAIGGEPFEAGGDQNAAVHRLNAPDGAWVALPTVEGAIIRQGVGVDALGRIIVFGGVNGVDPEQDAGGAFVYDDFEGQWNNIAERGGAAPIAHFAWAADDDGRLYSIGGGPGETADAGDPNTSYVERYIGTTDAWTTLNPLPSARADAAAVADAHGRILVIGGIDAHATQRLASVVAYDITAGTWDATTVPPLPAALSDHRAVRGPDDRIYVIGGVAGPIGAGTIQPAVWVLDAAGATWTAGPALTVPRYGFAAMVGFDEDIFVGGGLTTGGVAMPTCERLSAPACPVVVDAPGSRSVWSGQTLTLTGEFDASTALDLQWRHDGAVLEDGPAPGGGTISGATTATLIVTPVGAADAGTYVLEATNPCGTTATPDAAIEVRVADPIPATWTWSSLHGGALASRAYATDGTTQAGEISYQHPDYGTLTRPVLWTETAGSMVDLTPAGSVGGAARTAGGGAQAGWYWWPYTCQVGGQSSTCYRRRAARWYGGPATHEFLHGSGWEYSSVEDTDGVIFIGSVSRDDEVGNYFADAVLFNGGYSTTSLADNGLAKAYGTAIDGARRYGTLVTPNPGATTHAAMWASTTAPLTDLHPPGASRSWISAAGDGQQVGHAEFAGTLLPCLWADSPLSVTVLATTGGTVNDCAGGYQVGVTTGGAAIWNGTPDAHFSLGALLPSRYSGGVAEGVHVAVDGTIEVVGHAYDTEQMRTEAILWRSGAAACPGDTNGDGDVDVDDLNNVILDWGSDGSAHGGDVTGALPGSPPDGIVDVNDLNAVFVGWGTCP